MRKCKGLIQNPSSGFESTCNGIEDQRWCCPACAFSAGKSGSENIGEMYIDSYNDACVWTDYPLISLGDIPNAIAPIRSGKLLAYDGNKYCKVKIFEKNFTIKAGYLYSKSGRVSEVDPISDMFLCFHEDPDLFLRLEDSK